MKRFSRSRLAGNIWITCPLHSSDAKSERFWTRLSEWNLPILVIGYIRSATNIPHNASYLRFSVNTSIKSSSHLAKSKMPHQRQWSCFASVRRVPWMTIRRLRKRTLTQLAIADGGVPTFPCFLLFAGPVARSADPPQCFYINEWLRIRKVTASPLEWSTNV